LRRIISDAGYMPVQRDTLYRCYYLKQDSAAAAATAALPA
jgi:2-iminoacetate synthase ThiH